MFCWLRVEGSREERAFLIFSALRVISSFECPPCPFLVAGTYNCSTGDDARKCRPVLSNWYSVAWMGQILSARLRVLQLPRPPGARLRASPHAPSQKPSSTRASNTDGKVDETADSRHTGNLNQNSLNRSLCLKESLKFSQVFLKCHAAWGFSVLL